MPQNQNNNTNNNNRGFRWSDLLLIVVIVALIAGAIILYTSSTNTKTEFTYQDFTRYLSGEGSDTISEVTSINITPAGSENESLYIVTGYYKNKAGNKVGYIVYLPEDAVDTYLLPYAKTNNITATSYTLRSTTSWLSILIYIGLPILMIVLLFFVMSRTAKGQDQSFTFGKSRARLSTKTTTTFKDVAGCDEEKQEMEEIIDFLKYPKKYQEIGAHVPKGVILVGPPGTGKTLLAKAVAGEAKVPFYSISGSDFVEMFVGVGAARVRDMFKTAKQTAPCILFIDEIDAVGRQRGTGLGGGHDEREQTLNQLLVEMDGFEPNSGVIVMAATNRVDILDPALLRPGRFDRQIHISNPDVNGREAILKVHARNKHLSNKVNLADIAKRTPGFSGADLSNLLNEAALLAARGGRKTITTQDIDEAIDRVIAGPAKKSRKYSETEKKIVSYHEAGHAVIGLKLDNAEVVQKVTIVPRGDMGGYTMMTPEEEHFLQTKDQLTDSIVGLLGGRCGEEILGLGITTGAYNDFERATKIARAMVTEYGMSDLGPIQYESNNQNVFLGRDYMNGKSVSEEVAIEIDKAERKIINECNEKCRQILNENKDLLKLIADSLYEIETLTKEDIEELASTGKISWWEEKKQEQEAERIAKEKEAELKAIYENQLKAMNQAKTPDEPTEADTTHSDQK